MAVAADIGLSFVCTYKSKKDLDVIHLRASALNLLFCVAHDLFTLIFDNDIEVHHSSIKGDGVFHCLDRFVDSPRSIYPLTLKHSDKPDADGFYDCYLVDQHGEIVETATEAIN
jgi:hypothetical protein